MINEKINLPFYISTNDKHHDCLKVFIEIFYHFLPQQELVVLGYKKPQFLLPDSCSFISMGVQGPVEEWSTDLRRFFLNCQDKYFIYGTEDTFLYKKPNVKFINYLSDNLNFKNKIVNRINLVNATEGDNCTLKDSPHYRVNFIKTFNEHRWESWDLYSQAKDSNYSLTTQFSIWNKDFLLKYLIDGLTPWQFELSSSKVTAEEKKNIYMIDKNYPIFKKEGYSLGTWTNQEYWKKLLKNKTKNELF
jgi:hypothetical protein